MVNNKNQTNRKTKKRICVTLALLGFLGIGSIIATQARRNILDAIKPYTEKTEFKVLEIVPTSANDEIGYFVSEQGGDAKSEGKADFKDVSKAKSLGGRSETDVNAPLYKEELQNLIKLREYGLVKFEGIDRGVYNVDVSEYPIYSQMATFIKRATDGYTLLDNQYVQGTYKDAPNNNGSYFLKDGYTISGNGLIYKETEVEMEVPVKKDPDDGSLGDSTVTENTIPEGGSTVSPNDGPKPEETERVKVKIYELVPAGNPDNKQLPEAVEQRFDEDGELRMDGNVTFVQDNMGSYYGFTNDAYYVYAKPDATTNAFRNGDWFKEYVLGDRASNKKVTIDTVEADKVKTDMLGSTADEKYDLIYISGSYDAYANAGKDLSEEVITSLYNLATLPGYQAIIMDYKLLGSASSDKPTNIEKLALLLWQKDQRSILSMNTDGLEAKDCFTLSGDVVTKLPGTASSTWSVLGGTINSTPGMSTGNFVAGSVYVYDHKREYFMGSKAQVDAGEFFATGDFATEYTTGVVAGGFVPVKIAVQMNNLNHADKKVSEAITPATIIQYILSYDGTNPSLVKTELRILEIQPVRAFRYNTYWGTTAYGDCTSTVQNKRKEFIKDFLDDRFADNPSLVSFTSMTIEEFIGRNADINEEYDMIYIGSDTSHTIETVAEDGTKKDETLNYYYQTKGKSRVVSVDAKGNVTRKTEDNVSLSAFNDNANMCGNLYYNIGDTFYVGTLDSNTLDSLLGIIDDGTKYQNKTQKSRARFAGRDLTEDKLKDLKEFLDAGYPVVVAADIMRCVSTGDSATGLSKEINPTAYKGDDKDGVYDHGRVDNSSKLYEFLSYGVYGAAVKNSDETITYSGTKENLISEGDVKVGFVKKSEISEYLNKPKLSVNITSRPVEYSYSTTEEKSGSGTEAVIDQQTKLSPDPVTQKYHLDYEFTITNAGALASTTDTYNVHLYIDVNADGKFSEQEELKDCTVTNAVTGAEVQPKTTVDGKSYELQPDVLYKLHRQIPDGYSGILPWNLEVVMENNILVRASESGYTLVPRPTADLIEIDILQINNNKTTLDLSAQMANPEGANNYFGLYLDKLKDYEVKIKTVSQKNFQVAGDALSYKHVNDYDMLILGFGDCYDAFTEEKAVDAIISFIEAGKPVLLTHDLVMFRSGAIQTKKLRNYVGMDRYGCYDYGCFTEDASGKKTFLLRVAYPFTRSGQSTIFDKIESAGHRVVYLPNSEKNTTDYTTQGVSNLTVVRYRHKDSNNWNRYIANHNGIKTVGIGSWNDQKEYMVHNINEGQITTYPYILPDSFNIAQTHNQYYQLDMEGDMDKDGETDIVVWYTLGNRYDGGEKDPGFKGNGSEYTFTPNDVVNGYYIYNKGNVTYSGVGHSKPGSNASQKYEAQLFVNTMIAAYRAGTRAPKMTFYESERADAQEITSLPVVYDKNVGKNAETGDAESSVLRFEDGTFKNEFVDTGAQSTKLYFELEDENLVRGEKGIKLEFYLEDSSGAEEITIDGQKIKVTKFPLTVYNSDFTNALDTHVPLGTGVDIETDEDCMLQPATRYGIELPLSKLKDQGELKLYVSAVTTIYNKTVSNSIVTQKSPTSYVDFSVIKMDLLDLD